MGGMVQKPGGFYLNSTSFNPNKVPPQKIAIPSLPPPYMQIWETRLNYSPETVFKQSPPSFYASVEAIEPEFLRRLLLGSLFYSYM